MVPGNIPLSWVPECSEGRAQPSSWPAGKRSMNRRKAVEALRLVATTHNLTNKISLSNSWTALKTISCCCTGWQKNPRKYGLSLWIHGPCPRFLVTYGTLQGRKSQWYLKLKHSHWERPWCSLSVKSILGLCTQIATCYTCFGLEISGAQDTRSTPSAATFNPDF